MKKILLSIILFQIFAVTVFASVSSPESNTVAENPLQSNQEEQIPLKLIDANKSEVTNTTSQKVTLTIGLLIVLIGAGYYGVKRFSFASKPGQSNMQIKILSQHYLGPKKSLAIIRVAGESILIGVTDQNISMIKALSLLDEELPQVLPKNFQDSMDQKNIQDMEADDFSIEKLSTTVSQKIKSMRNIQ